MNTLLLEWLNGLSVEKLDDVSDSVGKGFEINNGIITEIWEGEEE